MPPAKKFVPRQRKHKVRARLAREANDAAEQTGTLGDVPHDYPGMPAASSNSDMILPEEQRERNEKKAKLRAELRANQASQMSAKKAKRLEKYIETKLRKDESRELNDRLGAKAVDIAIFESSKDLGKGKKRRRAEKAKKDSRAQPLGDDTDMESDDDESSGDDEAAAPVVSIANKAAKAAKAAPKQNTAAQPEAKPAVEEAEPTPAPAPAQTGSSLFGSFTVAAGSGLKRPLDLGDDGRPVLKKRVKRGGVKSKYEIETVHEKPSMVVIKPPPFSNFDESDEAEDEDEDEDESDSDDEDMNDLTAGQIAKSKKDVEKDGSEDDDDDDEDDDDDDEDDDDDDDEQKGSSSSESESSPDSEPEDATTTKKSAFKDWATKMRNEALGHQPSADAAGGVLYEMPQIENFAPRAVEQDPLPASLQPTTRLDRKAFHVDVQRPAAIEESRMHLPVVAEEQQIIEAIHEHDVVVISGGTGSGKTTQVPQFLYEAGFGNRNSENPGMIGVTQPRRVAAVSMARRVAEELGPEHGRAVAYQIRYESSVSSETAIKFMTDGVLLREVSQDIVLSKYSVIVIDEAHERSINTDVLIGVASRVNTMRAEVNRMREEEQAGGATATATTYTPMRPLKIIVMSATLQVTEFTQNPKLFPTPPRVIDIEGRQYPVTVHFAQKTRHDYVEEAFRKIVRGHRKLPPGGFLVFLTGEDEIQRLAKRLRLEINGVHSAAGPKVRLPATEVPYEAEDIEFGGGLEDEQGGDAAFLEGEEDLDPEHDDFDEEDDETEFVPDEGETAGSGPQGVHVLPLFSKLPTKEQQRVFQPAPETMRQIVLATNVAETSLTIPGIRYVFDCGRAKARTFNRQTGVQSFEIGWISKASANQRSGRAGRTGPGHCYRLYSSAVYEENFAEFADPEILRMPIEGVVLQLKALGTPHIDVFPFPTPPDRARLIKAEGVLTYLSALHPRKDAQSGPAISEFGRLMSVFPLSPRFAKILMVGHPADCIHYVIALVAALSTEEIFVRPNNAFPPPSATSTEVAADDDDDDKGSRKPVRTQDDIRQDELRRQTIELFKKVHRQFASLDDKSDALKLLQVVGEFSHEPTEAWCKGHFVHFKALREVQKMRRQITNLLRTSMPVHAAANLSYQEQLPRPSDDQIRLLKQMLAAGFVDNVAIRADLLPTAPEHVARKPRRAIEVPYKPLFPIGSGGGGPAKDPNDELAFIHPSSVMAHLTVAECPPYVIFSHLQRSQPSAGAAVAAAADDASGKPVAQPKVRMRALTDVTGLQLSSLLQGTPLLRYGKPIKEVWRSDTGREREVFVVPELKPDTGATSQGWPLPAAKVRQVKDASIRGGWTVVPRPNKQG